MKKVDGAKVLSGLSGLPKAEVLSIWEQVKANQRRLDGCAGPHDFSIDLFPGKALGKRWRCTKCAGEVDEIAKGWYEKGIAHAKA